TAEPLDRDGDGIPERRPVRVFPVLRNNLGDLRMRATAERRAGGGRRCRRGRRGGAGLTSAPRGFPWSRAGSAIILLRRHRKSRHKDGETPIKESFTSHRHASVPEKAQRPSYGSGAALTAFLLSWRDGSTGGRGDRAQKRRRAFALRRAMGNQISRKSILV